MALEQLHLPDIGDFEGVEIIEMLAQAGDTVAEEDSLMTLESDKATMEIPSPISGTIKEWKVGLGDKVSTGDLIAMVEVEAGASAPAPAKEERKAAPAVAAQPEPAKAAPTPAPVAPSAPAAQQERPINTQSAGAKFHASPSVRRFARELGVELEHVSGQGPKGRILQTDIQSFVKSVMQGKASVGTQGGAGIPPIPTIDFSQFGETETVDLSRIKKVSGQHLSKCWLNVPHVTQFDEADITEMEAFRQSMKDQAAKEGIKLTPLVFIMKAVVAALKAYPNFNASLSSDGSQLIVKKYINIGVAVDTPNGLVVPVIKDADKKSLYDLSRELIELSGKAREGKLSPADMSGGTFTISSLGGIGGTNFTPIVNAPEVGILGVARSAMKPVWNGSEFEPRLMLPLSVSYDHRVIDGAEGARFTTTISRYLTDIRQMLL